MDTWLHTKPEIRRTPSRRLSWCPPCTYHEFASWRGSERSARRDARIRSITGISSIGCCENRGPSSIINTAKSSFHDFDSGKPTINCAKNSRSDRRRWSIYAFSNTRHTTAKTISVRPSTSCTDCSFFQRFTMLKSFYPNRN